MYMNLLRTCIFLFLLVGSINSCSYFVEDQLINLAMVQSPVFDCCNEWDGFGTSEDTIEERVKMLFEDKEIPITKVWLTENDLRVVCFHCCRCPGAQVIHASIDKAFIEEASGLGFEIK